MMPIFACFLGALVLIETASSTAPYDYVYMQSPSPCQPHLNITVGQGGWSRYGFVFSDDDECYNENSNCAFVMTAPLDYHIVLRFLEMEIDCPDALYISDNQYINDYCGFNTPSTPINSPSNFLIFRFITYNYNAKCQEGFSLVYTSFHYGECASNEFKCANDGRCIPSEVKCDYYDNCGDWSDERAEICGLSTGAIVAISVTCALVGIACIAFILYCIYDKSYRRNSRHHRRNSSRRSSFNATTTEPIPISSVQPIGPPNYADAPPSYTYIHSNPAFDGVYDNAASSNGVVPPPTYQSFVTPPYETNTFDTLH